MASTKTEAPTGLTDISPHNWDRVGGFECRLGMSWEPLGRVTLGDDGRLTFPKAVKAPALYRLRIRLGERESVYIGETDNLSRRFGNYRNPGPSQQTSRRINATLLGALQGGAEIAVAIVRSGAWIDWGTGSQEADLSSKVVRCLFENAAISDGDGHNIEMLNRATR